MRVYIRTYGCQMNERDSESVAAWFAERGWEVAAAEEEADLVIVNTCSVREKAEDKALGKLRLLAAAKGGRPGRIVGAMGCMVQRRKEELFDRVPGLDFAIGAQRLSALPEIVRAVEEGRRGIADAASAVGRPDEDERHAAAGVTAFVNVLYGCNRRCAYCIVPDVRGPEWSRPAAAIVGEVRRLAARGTREVTLLGQSVMSYGRANDAWAGASASPAGFFEPLPRLLEALDRVEGLARLRFTSGHPSGCTAELARAMAQFPAVCAHLHLPLQSGSDAVLARMRRGYTAADYRAAAARLRAAVPALALTTDVIVGFPGETREDFDATLGLMDEIDFDNAFIFKYSPRPGTPAAAWPDDVPPDEKRRRNQAAIDVVNRHSRARHEAEIGREVEVLVEGVSRRIEARWFGRTSQNVITVFVPDAGTKAGDVRRVLVERATPQALYGRLVEE